MPTYNYACSNCGHTADLVHPMADCDNPHLCPNCGTDMTRQLQAMSKHQTQLLGYWETRDGYTSSGRSIKG